MIWKPSASLHTLKQRAALMSRVRDFFSQRDIMEVDTPILSAAAVTDPHIHSLSLSFQPQGFKEAKQRFLQTSPEYAMKRLLAAGCGPIYQICKSFRLDTPGSRHSPEFTMLEWYQPNYDHHALMNEMDDFLQALLKTPAAKRITYADLFFQETGLNPHTVSLTELTTFGNKHFEIASPITSIADWLDLIMSHCIEPSLGLDRPVFIYDFPISHAALARIRLSDDLPVASRFEVYFKGIELANGFHELQNANEQRERFVRELKHRQQMSLPSVPLDERFLAALQAGLPDCSGVALGIDRLMMLALEAEKLSEVLSFDFDSA